MSKGKTFERQDALPSLPVPPLKESLKKYILSAGALLSREEVEKLRNDASKFESSDLARQLQEALETRARTSRNWLEDWWYDAYNEIRGPLAPFLSFGALNTNYNRLNGGQLSRAADVLHHWCRVWLRVRREQWPITMSRGIVWDMSQFYYLFNASRTPRIPLDVIERFFKTESEGSCPSHVTVNCRGTLWSVDVVGSDGEIKSPQELYATLEEIYKNSQPNQAECIATLTAANRDAWAKMREELMGLCPNNAANLQHVEQSILFLTLTDASMAEEPKGMRTAMMDECWYYWQDKSVNINVYEDAQVAVQGEHSNLDAIVLLQAGDEVAGRVSKSVWSPTSRPTNLSRPRRLDFALNGSLKEGIAQAATTFKQFKESYRAQAVHFHGFGNERCRVAKIYADTVVQVALQLAFAKTHGSLAPIYETASTRKFFHGRTETVRGCTPQLVRFVQAIVDQKPLDERSKLFQEAMNAHNWLMNECMEGRGFDRHLMGLKKTLEQFNKGCSPKRSLPEFLNDDAWRRTGGDGNFLLSTSLTGYMLGDELGAYGFVNAMRADGYGCFYRIGKTRITVVVSDWVGTKSNGDAFAANLLWAFDQLGQLIPKAPESAKL